MQGQDIRMSHSARNGAPWRHARNAGHSFLSNVAKPAIDPPSYKRQPLNATLLNQETVHDSISTYRTLPAPIPLLSPTAGLHSAHVGRAPTVRFA